MNYNCWKCILFSSIHLLHLTFSVLRPVYTFHRSFTGLHERTATHYQIWTTVTENVFFTEMCVFPIATLDSTPPLLGIAFIL